MKKLFVILCLMVMLPTFCFAANSPTIRRKVTSTPELMFVISIAQNEWDNIEQRLDTVKDETDGYILLESVKACLDKPYKKIEWNLMQKVTSEHEPFVFIINSEAIIKQEVSVTSDGAVVVDFTDFEPNIYYILFYIRKGA